MGFDTSAINALASDPDGKEVVHRLLMGHHRPFISILNVAEIGATSDPIHRGRLLRVVQDLMGPYYPLARPGASEELQQAIAQADSGKTVDHAEVKRRFARPAQ